MDADGINERFVKLSKTCCTELRFECAISLVLLASIWKTRAKSKGETSSVLPVDILELL